MTDRPDPWPRRAYVVSHTHWDREWYLPFDRFRVRLVDVVRRALHFLEHDPDFHHFLLDGQSVLLEDYFEIHPEDRPRVSRLVQRGALAIGPWYVLPDEFLVSGEALVRNLVVGDRVARQVGPPQKVGYLPDSFGHIAQMPQLLRHAGIDTFVFTRGTGDELDELGWEFLWQAPDGSTVTAVNQCDGYCAAAGLGFDVMSEASTERAIDPARAVARVGTLFERMRPLAQGDICLLSNGCDHDPPQQSMAEVLAALRQAFPGTEFIHTSLSEYLEAVKAGGYARQKYRGELLGGKRQFILPGVWSARMYLKQANDAAQVLLTGVVEPLAAYAHFFRGTKYPGALIESAWKSLLRNHPHDSICGCSVDPVHRAMLTRFDSVLHTGDQLVRDHLRALAPRVAPESAGDAETVLAVFNPLPFRRTEVLERLVVLSDSSQPREGWELVDGDGRAVPFALVRYDRVAPFWGTDFHSEWQGDRQLEAFEHAVEPLGSRVTANIEDGGGDTYYQLHVLASGLPAVGHASYRLQASSGARRAAEQGSIRAGADWAENDLVRVQLHPDGTFDLEDKASGVGYRGLNRLVDEADVGDEYDFAPSAVPGTVTSEGLTGRVRLVVESPWLARLELRAAWGLPESILPDRATRSTTVADNPICLRLTLRHGSPVVEVDLSLENRGRDHRLRVAFPTGVVSDTVLSDGHFMLSERPLCRPERPEWVQPPSGTWPQQDFSLIQDGTRGLVVLNRGLPEIQATPEGGAVTLWLTLLRAVGWLSRDDFATRKHATAGPMVPTPDAQCLGPQRFRYAVAAFTGPAIAAGVPRLSSAYHTPVPAVQGVASGHVPGGEGLLEVASANTRVTAIKKHDHRESLVVRLYNMTGDPIEEIVTVGRAVAEAWRIDFLEERIEPVSSTGNRLVIDLRGHEIVTLEVGLEGHA
jgi:mannosylglycerate hydrolase